MFNILKLSRKKKKEKTNQCSIDIEELREKLINSISKEELSRDLLREVFGSKNIDILFLSVSKNNFIDPIQKLDISTKFLNNQSLLGRVFLSKAIFFTTDIKREDQYNLAIDNPYNSDIEQQIIIPIVGNDIVEGFLRFSGSTCNEESLIAICSELKKLNHVFREMYLYHFNQKMNQLKSSPFGNNSCNTYTILHNIKDLYEDLNKHAQHPEVQKLINTGLVNVDTIFEYINPNLENVSRIKNAMFKIDSQDTDTNYKARILLVDDVFLNLKILNSMLVYDWVEQISFAGNGLESIDKIESTIADNKHIDILFLDHHMPGMMGLEVAEYLQEKSKNSPSYNVIIVSITNDPEAILNKLNLYDYHLSKPFSRAEVDTIMKEIKENIIYK